MSDSELLALPRYRSSDLFTEGEKAALDYTVAVMRTPVEVTDEVFARMREHFSDKQIVEITALLTLVNVDRFNAAFGIGSAGFSAGRVCVLPDRPQAGPSVATLTSDSRPA
jgi:4-carboxymuconolactone decarboxylase